ncbi:MAG: hypothetical protein ACFHW5_08550 [Verrucomicrobiota bacterium]
MKFGDGDRRIARQGHASCQCVDERGGICILADPARLACVLWCGLLIISLAGPEAMFIPFALAVSFSFTLAISIPVSVSIVRVFGSDSVFLTFPFPISSPVRTVVAGLRRAQGMLAGPFDGFLVGGELFWAEFLIKDASSGHACVRLRTKKGKVCGCEVAMDSMIS